MKLHFKSQTDVLIATRWAIWHATTPNALRIGEGKMPQLYSSKQIIAMGQSVDGNGDLSEVLELLYSSDERGGRSVDNVHVSVHRLT